MPLRMTSVSSTGASVTMRSSPTSCNATIRPVAELVASITEPIFSFDTFVAFRSRVHVSPSALAERIAAAPLGIGTTSGWYFADPSAAGP